MSSKNGRKKKVNYFEGDKSDEDDSSSDAEVTKRRTGSRRSKPFVMTDEGPIEISDESVESGQENPKDSDDDQPLSRRVGNKSSKSRNTEESSKPRRSRNAVKYTEEEEEDAVVRTEKSSKSRRSRNVVKYTEEEVDDHEPVRTSRNKEKSSKSSRSKKVSKYTEEEEDEDEELEADDDDALNGKGSSQESEEDENLFNLSLANRRRMKRSAAKDATSGDENSPARTSRRDRNKVVESSRDSSPQVPKKSRRSRNQKLESDADDDEDGANGVDSENNKVDLTESEDDGSEVESPPRKKKKKNLLNEVLEMRQKLKADKSKSKRKKKKKKAVSDSDDSGSRSGRQIRGSKKRKRKEMEDGGESGSGDDFVSGAAVGGHQRTGRVRTKVKYENAESGGDFSENSDNEDLIDATPVEEIDIEGIDKVMDHREGKVGATGDITEHFNILKNGDPNETLETEATEAQYLIKWQGKAHIFNTWETEKTLDDKKVGNVKVKGHVKLNKYQQRVSDYNAWKKRANPDDVEYQELDLEMDRELARTYKEAERVFCRRKNDEEDKTEYFIKWRNLPYSESTWEDETLVKEHYLPKYELFKKIKKAKAEPKNYKASMKGIRPKFKPMKEQPDYIGGPDRQMRDYQLDGISFLIAAWCKGNSVILADEMGLGKTIQTICFLKYLFHNYSFKGPMLVCVPLSTIAAWQKEFAQWAPDMNAITYLGDAKSREIIREYECENDKGDLCFNVLITSYEMVWKDKSFFSDIVWSNIVVDEAHRLKNEESLLYKVLTTIDSHHRLLLTGTPLQNNLKELWCLLNYLRLEEIGDWDYFEGRFGQEADVAGGYVGLHSLLKPYIIRRLKKDVEKSMPPKVEQILRVEMTKKQKNMYKMVLTKNFDFLNKGGKNQVSLINVFMQLRKTSNHIELIHEQDLEVQKTPEERYKELIYGSGKMLLLDKLLTRFKEKGDRVLIFSQFVIMLNLIEEFLLLKRLQYRRLDGSTNSDKRKQAIDQFNDPTSNDFCFLLSTKAGGLGINLQTANRVIIYDSDFNPQNDLQAIARAHRIGQKQEVQIYRFVASCSVDEDIIQRAKNKMVLDHLVIQNMDTTGKAVLSGKKNKNEVAAMSKDELNTVIKFGAADLFKETDEAGDEDKEVDLDAILEKAEKREEEEAPTSEANKELLSAFKCTNLRFQEEEEEKVEEKKPSPKKGEQISWDAIIPENMREKPKEKPKFIDGLEVLDDPEDLFVRRKRRRNKKGNKETIDISDDDDDKGSDYNNSSSSNSESEEEEEDENLSLSLRNLFKKQNKLRNFPIDSFKCLLSSCTRRFQKGGHLMSHLRNKHDLPSTITSENFCNLPEVQSQTGICHFCRLKYAMKEVDYKVHINQIHGGQEPEVNYNITMLRDFNRYHAMLKHQSGGENASKKNLICLECSRCVMDANYLRLHMKSVHQIMDFELTEKNFLQLPVVQSSYFRCFPCGAGFKPLQYKLHIMTKHKLGNKPFQMFL